MRRGMRWAWALAIWAGVGQGLRAGTVYVDQSSTNSVANGTRVAPYRTIVAAIADNNSSVIVVYPGTYREQLSIAKNVELYAYDGPHTTRLEGSGAGNVVSLGLDLVVRIEGFTISSGVYGLYQSIRGTLWLRNCVFCGNSSHGVYVDRTTNASADAANVFVYNCVFVANGGSGVFLQCYVWNYGNAFGYPNLTAYNSVMIRNSRYGVEAGSTGGPTLGTIRLDCNNYNNNAMGKYSDLFGPGKPVSPGANSIDVSPEFVGGSGDVCGQDLRLAPTSPCRDKGQPGTAWLDPDGTRNDLGAYGGPGAQRFYTFPNDGPFIREVTIPQGMVPYGTTFTIRARAAVR